MLPGTLFLCASSGPATSDPSYKSFTSTLCLGLLISLYSHSSTLVIYQANQAHANRKYGNTMASIDAQSRLKSSNEVTGPSVPTTPKPESALMILL